MLAPLIDPDALPAPDSKYSPTHLYYRQHHTVQIIELVECTAPPPRNIASVINDATVDSDYTSSSDYDSDFPSEDDARLRDGAQDDDDDEDGIVSSYCSSDIPPEHPHSAPPTVPIRSSSPATTHIELASESYSTTKRILAWRENFVYDFDAALLPSDPPSLSSASSSALSSSSSSPSSLKRKLVLDDDDAASHTSKRSRCNSQASLPDPSALTTASLAMHPCPACDASFLTLQDLRQHGRDSANDNEACSVAVEYAFE